MVLGKDSLPNAQSEQSCFILSDSTQCPTRNGIAVAITNEYKNTNELDEFVLKRSNANSRHIEEFRSEYACPQYDGTGKQFHTTMICSMITQNSTNCSLENTAFDIPMCKKTCNQAVQSLEKVFNNICSKGNSSGITARTETLNSYKKYCSGLKISNPNIGKFCLDGSNQPQEANTCGTFLLTTGFGTVTEAQTYCKELNNADKCCSLLKTQFPENYSVTKQPIYVPLLVALGGIFIVGILFFKAQLCKKNRRNYSAKTADITTPLYRTNPEGEVQKTVKVIATYHAKMSDELDINVGESLLLFETYDDGWALGKHLQNEKIGLFPLICTIMN